MYLYLSGHLLVSSLKEDPRVVAILSFADANVKIDESSLVDSASKVEDMIKVCPVVVIICCSILLEDIGRDTPGSSKELEILLSVVNHGVTATFSSNTPEELGESSW